MTGKVNIYRYLDIWGPTPSSELSISRNQETKTQNQVSQETRIQLNKLPEDVSADIVESIIP